MVRLTADVVSTSPQFLNPLREREIDLRGCKIPAIENLGATADQFDVIDLTDNDIRKVENFPLLRRLKRVFVANNRITRIASGLESSIAGLDTLILTNNQVCRCLLFFSFSFLVSSAPFFADDSCIQITSFAQVKNLSTLPALRTLSLVDNPIVRKPHYRAYVVHTLPHLRILDFRRIRPAVRLWFKRACVSTHPWLASC